MPRVQVEETVDVPRDALFAVLADHARYDRFPGVVGSELVREGTTERDGLGALRRINLGISVLEEEIVAYDAPNSFEYLITKVRPLPVNHILGRVEFFDEGPARTRVVWVSEFEIPLPIVGGFVGRRAASQFTRAFRTAIRVAAKLSLPQAA